MNKKIAVGGWIINVAALSKMTIPFLTLGLTGDFFAIMESVRNTNEIANVEGYANISVKSIR